MTNLTSHCFNVSLASEIGVSEAIILQHFFFWYRQNKGREDMTFDDRVWCFSSRKNICEMFPYFSEQHIRTCIGHLIDRGLLVKGNYNSNSFYKANWYALTDEALSLFGEIQPIHQLETTTPLVEINQSIDSNKQDNNIKIKKDISKDISKENIGLPYSSEAFLEMWNTLVEQPKWRRKSPAALRMSAKKLAQYDEATAILMMEEAIANDWQGLFPPKGRPASQKKGSLVSHYEQVLREANDRIDNGYYGK